MIRKALWIGMFAALLGVQAISRSLAQGFPSKPVRLVVPFAVGGTTDVLGRLLAQQLGNALGQPVIVENKPGAGSALGAEMVAKSPADGYTVLMGSASTFTINPAIYPKLSYDPLKSFVPVAMVGTAPLVLLAHPSVPASNFKELVALVSPKPGAFTYGSFGNGSTAHFAGELLNSAARIQMTHVPYKGAAPAMNDLVGGQINLMFDTITTALPQVKAGRVKAIAVTTRTRSKLMPDVGSIAEAGFPYHVETWTAIVAPAGTPEPALKRLRVDMAKVLADKDIRQRLVAMGFEPFEVAPEEYMRIVRQEIDLFIRIARDSNIRPD